MNKKSAGFFGFLLNIPYFLFFLMMVFVCLSVLTGGQFPLWLIALFSG